MDANQLNRKNFSKELWIETFWDIDQPWMHVLQLVFRNKKKDNSHYQTAFLRLYFTIYTISCFCFDILTNTYSF